MSASVPPSIPVIAMSAAPVDAHSPESLKQAKKDKPRVPSSGRGGLGNIRAKNQAKPSPPSSPSSTYSAPIPHFTSFSFSQISSFHSAGSATRPSSSSRTSITSGSGTGSSGASLCSACSAPASMSTERERWAGASGSALSALTRAAARRSVDEAHMAALVEGEYLEHGHGHGHDDDSAYDLASYAHTHLTHATGSSSSSSTGSAYAAHLEEDASARRAGKALAGSGSGSASAGAGGDGKVVVVRTGRGGAGVYRKEGESVDAGLFPTTAALTRVHEARLAAQERALVEASRARAAASHSTGRGGAGNIGTVSGKKNVSTSKLERMRKGKGRAGEGGEAEAEAQGEGEGKRCGHQRSQSLPRLAAPPVGKGATQQQQRKGLKKLWRRVTGAGVPVHAQAGPAEPGLEVGAGPATDASASREGRGAASLLTFVVAAAPHLGSGGRGAYVNVLGVPGTPGFPIPGAARRGEGRGGGGGGGGEAGVGAHRGTRGAQVPVRASSRSRSQVRTARGAVMQVRGSPGEEEEAWVDDGDGDEDEDKDEDSDIDPGRCVLAAPSPPPPQHVQRSGCGDRDDGPPVRVYDGDGEEGVVDPYAHAHADRLSVLGGGDRDSAHTCDECRVGVR